MTYDIRWGYLDASQERPAPPFFTHAYELGRQLYAYGRGYNPEALVDFLNENLIWSKM